MLVISQHINCSISVYHCTKQQ